MTRPSEPARRIDGWGFTGESYPPPAAMKAWLSERLGDERQLPALDAATLRGEEPATLPDLGCAVSQELPVRFACSRGQGLPDLLRLRSGSLPRLADGVARPADVAELRQLLTAGDRHGLVIIPRGGGTSVTGGVNVPLGDAPVVVADLDALSGLEDLDENSGLATFGAGTAGPEIETALAAKGWTLGHFPQSWELSTLGGWIVTRSAGQESLGYGRIETLVAGLEVVAPAGELRLPAMPASASGPDLRRLVLGSEGRFGVVTRATVRIRRRPSVMRVEAVLLPGWEAGSDAARQLVQSGVPLQLLRLSDAVETEVAMAAGLAQSALGSLVRGWLRLRGFGEGACLLLLGAAGTRSSVTSVFEEARRTLRPHGSVWLGSRPGHKWLADRFRHPYLRDALLDLGYATETFETAAPWSKLSSLYATVQAAMKDGGAEGERSLPLLCHISHPYRDGASLYFTFFFRCPREPDRAVARWAELKRRASQAVADGGGTLSHHHGVGSWHAPWLAEEVGDDGCRLMRRMAAELDPRGVLNPHILLGDPSGSAA